jgi:hypothetical protein
METTAKISHIRYHGDRIRVTFELANVHEAELQALQEWQEKANSKGEPNRLSVAVKKLFRKRSRDSNSYLWVILQKMAEVLHTSKDELYIEMLSRYGVFTHIVVKPNVVERVKEEWRTVRELGEVKVGETKGIQLQCYFGSSTYDSREMSRLIDGVVSEAKLLDIETLPPEELERMNAQWANYEK